MTSQFNCHYFLNNSFDEHFCTILQIEISEIGTTKNSKKKYFKSSNKNQIKENLNIDINKNILKNNEVKTEQDEKRSVSEVKLDH